LMNPTLENYCLLSPPSPLCHEPEETSLHPHLHIH